MDVNQVRFGSYSIGNPQNGSLRGKNKDAGETQQKQNLQPQAQTLSAEEMFNALSIMGAQNKASINKVDAVAINPSDYLSDARMGEIEAMMAEFENGVNEVAEVIEQEFPGLFAADKKNALAAAIFAKE